MKPEPTNLETALREGAAAVHRETAKLSVATTVRSRLSAETASPPRPRRALLLGAIPLGMAAILAIGSLASGPGSRPASTNLPPLALGKLPDTALFNTYLTRRNPLVQEFERTVADLESAAKAIRGTLPSRLPEV